jgi:hypothetical protein
MTASKSCIRLLSITQPEGSRGESADYRLTKTSWDPSRPVDGAGDERVAPAVAAAVAARACADGVARR